jgi:hypothetical protein
MTIPRALMSAALAAWWVVGPLWAQSQTAIPVEDQSAPGSPLSISGTASFWEAVDGDTLTYSIGENITAENVSTQPILAVVVSVRLLLPRGERQGSTTQFDYFFRPDLIAPGQTLPIFLPLGDARIVVPHRGGRTTMEHHAEARVLYAQFQDGSVFGSENDGEPMLNLRKKAWETLRRLDRIYTTQGPEEFLEALRQPVEPHDDVHIIVKRLLATAKQSGPASAEEKVQAMLTLGTRRQEMIGGPVN